MDYFFNQAISNKYLCSKVVSNYSIARKWLKTNTYGLSSSLASDLPSGYSQNRTNFLVTEKQADPNAALKEKCVMVGIHDRLYMLLLAYI